MIPARMESLRADPAEWTRWWWPWALVLSVSAYIASPPAWSAWALAGGAALIGVPELVCVLRRRFQDTFSEWVWDTLHIMQWTPIWDWSAIQVLSLGGYLVLAWRADWQLWGEGYWPGAGGLVLAVWLAWHLFGRWWR